MPPTRVVVLSWVFSLFHSSVQNAHSWHRACDCAWWPSMGSHCVCSGAAPGWCCSSSVLSVWSQSRATVFSLALLPPVLLILWGSLVTHSPLTLGRVPSPHDTALSGQLKDYSYTEVLHSQMPFLPLWKDSMDFSGLVSLCTRGWGSIPDSLSLNTCYQFYPNIPGCLGSSGKESPPRALEQSDVQSSSTLGFSAYLLLRLSFPPKAFSPRGAQDSSSIWTLWPFLPFSSFLPQPQDRLFPSSCPIRTLHLPLYVSVKTPQSSLLGSTNWYFKAQFWDFWGKKALSFENLALAVES